MHVILDVYVESSDQNDRLTPILRRWRAIFLLPQIAMTGKRQATGTTPTYCV